MNSTTIPEMEALNCSLTKLLKEKEIEINAPTIAKVVMWLYNEHGIWIGVYKQDTFRNIFHTKIQGSEGKNRIELKWFSSPIKAYEAAIEYVLSYTGPLRYISVK